MPTTCRRCKRVLHDRSSIAVEEGASCRKKTLAELSPEEREIEAMRGYTVTQVTMGGVTFYIIVNPAGKPYIYDESGCNCSSHERPCKHERMVRARYPDAFGPPKVRRMTTEEFEREAAIDYGKYHEDIERRLESDGRQDRNRQGIRGSGIRTA